MSVRVRLTRVGSKKNPIWRVVVSDQRSPRDGRFIETVGRYNPQTDPSTIVLDEERIRHWLGTGAQPTDRVARFLDRSGILPGAARQRGTGKKAAELEAKRAAEAAKGA